jgi:hypothetical protein
MNIEGRSFSDVWREAATALIKEEDLLTAIARLASVPVSMPEAAVSAVSRIPEVERLELFERLAAAWTSPLRRLHLVNLALRTSPVSDAALEIARKVLAKLYDADAGSKDFHAYLALLTFVNDEIEGWAESRHWSAEIRMAVTWAHASRLHGMLHGLGYSSDLMVSMLDGAGRSSFRESFTRDSGTWADCAHPRHINRTRFLTHSVASMLAGIDPSTIEAAGVTELIRKEVFLEVGEGIIFPQFSLLSDPALYGDVLLSVLGGDRYSILTGIIGSEGIEILSSENLTQGVKNYLEEMIADPQRVTNWTWLHMVTDDLPIYTELAELSRRALDSYDPLAARKDGFRSGWLIFRAAANQVVNIGGERLRQKFRDHLLEVLRYEILIDKEEISDTEFNSLERRVGALIEVASILSHIPNNPVRSSASFTSLLEMMAELWPDFSRYYRHILSREVWNLPIEEGESWWHLALRMRTAK